MNPETLEALKGSIEKWRKIVEEDGVGKGIDDCPLCQMFWGGTKSCQGCPVHAVSGDGCNHTPWEDWVAVSGPWPGIADTPRKLTAARAELDFLRSLLPKEVES
jgi:hypothetical protein